MVFALFAVVSVALVVLTTLWAGWIFSWLTIEPNPEEAKVPSWGALSEWCQAVVGVCVGFAGASIAIWLAFKVNEISAEQIVISEKQHLADFTATLIEIIKDDQGVGKRIASSIRASQEASKSSSCLYNLAISISDQGDQYENNYRNLEFDNDAYPSSNGSFEEDKREMRNRLELSVSKRFQKQVKNVQDLDPPPLKWSARIVRKRRIKDGNQATQAGRDCHEVTAG